MCFWLGCSMSLLIKKMHFYFMWWLKWGFYVYIFDTKAKTDWFWVKHLLTSFLFVPPQDHIPVPYQPDSSSNPSSTTSSTPSSPAPPLPSSATPPSPLHPSPQSARQQKQFNLTGEEKIIYFFYKCGEYLLLCYNISSDLMNDTV